MIKEGMDIRTSEQSEIRSFVNQNIIPIASHIDQKQKIPEETISLLAMAGYLGYIVDQKYNGAGRDMVSFGLLNEEFGKACSSVRSLITVQSMIAFIIQKWGDKNQKDTWLPKLAEGDVIASFALTEKEAGSDAQNIQTTFSPQGDYFLVNGRKKWITCGQIAGLILVFGKSDGKDSALIMSSNTPGLSVEPISGMLGVRGSMLADLSFTDCAVPRENIIGAIGNGLNPVAYSALNIGRYSIACGSLGMAKACFESSVKFSAKRKQFNKTIQDHQLIQRMIAEMLVDIRTAGLLCSNTGRLMDKQDPDYFKEVLIAKYHCTKTASRIAKDAVQIHGAEGCSSKYPVERFYRDSQIMEIIEGSNQIIQLLLSKYGFHEISNDC